VYVHKRNPRRITLSQRCPPVGSRPHHLTLTVRSDHKFAGRGPGGNGVMVVRGRFIHPNAHGHFNAVRVTVTNGCVATTRHWHLVAV
jgi:hypothetical protein